MMVLKKINEPDYQRVCVFFVGTTLVPCHISTCGGLLHYRTWVNEYVSARAARSDAICRAGAAPAIMQTINSGKN